MSNTMRGSEKLQGSCGTMRTLTSDEVNAVAGGASGILFSSTLVFPRGIPWPELFAGFNKNPVINPVVKF